MNLQWIYVKLRFIQIERENSIKSLWIENDKFIRKCRIIAENQRPLNLNFASRKFNVAYEKSIKFLPDKFSLLSWKESFYSFFFSFSHSATFILWKTSLKFYLIIYLNALICENSKVIFFASFNSSELFCFNDAKSN